ncbi:diguanylate cyclase domain-containing protein [Vibrio sp. HN007]|uniref:diguanylate cyclase domain-containing protein n=1 Tax=Vibrio iocasae TaxID=3098914 RepID=UPI0035D5019C
MNLSQKIGHTNYNISDKLHEGLHTTIYRGIGKADGTPVIVKMLNSEYPTPEQLARFRLEHNITQRLATGGVSAPICIEAQGNRALIVFKDIGGESLSKQLYRNGNKLSLEQSLRLAIRICNILEYVHSKRIIHKDINPTNIIWNPHNDRVELIDFGISSELSRETQPVQDPDVQEGTLAYMSPEQTGRMNRVIDYRTDLYSLGVTLYEMLTGCLPFDTRDPMELVHCHIAKIPDSPITKRAQIPQVVSDIVMKLLSKMAEDRYQAASGLAADLQRCLDALVEGKKIEPFEIGCQDPKGQFRISQKLYGREQEVQTLMSAFSRVSDGAAESLMVAGYSGVGKTSLVREIHRPVLEKRGYFISGKFEQFQHEIPYQPIIQAFQKLVQFLLAESDDKLLIWREALQAALNDEGQVLLDVIPELAHIIGSQPAVLELSGVEAQNRFNAVFKRFLGVFCTVEHPLVLFLDDLQWADPASLGLLKNLMANNQSSYLLLIGAYRDNEVTPSHPLMLTLDEVRQTSGSPLSTLTLTPLDANDSKALIKETLSATGDNIDELAQLLQHKTDGNPFFLTRLLSTLFDKKLLYYSPEKEMWCWDNECLEALSISENVAELLVQKIHTLPEKTLELLVIASCLGNRFELGMLTAISQRPAAEIADWLWEAVIEELIIPEDEACNIARWVSSTQEQMDLSSVSYRFYHDRVQEAAYSRLDEQRRVQVHLKAGRLLLNTSSEAEQKERIFELVNHLNTAVELISDPAECARLAVLNLEAGLRAKKSAAYDAALEYFTQGMDLLKETGWGEHYDAMFRLSKERIESEFLCGRLEEAEKVFSSAIGQTRSRRETGELYELMVRISHISYDYARGIELGMKGMQLFDILVPHEPEAYGKMTAELLEEINLQLPTRDAVLGLEHNPEMQDEDMITLCGILHETWVCLFMSANERVLLPALLMIKLSVEYGQSAVTAVGHIFYAIVLSSGQDYDRAYDFGRLAMGLKEKYFNPLLAPKVHNTFCNFVNHYKNHIRTNIPVYEESYRYCVQSGEIWWGAWAASFIRTAQFVKGDPLPRVLNTADTYADYIRAAEFEPLVQVMDAQVAKITHLMDQTGTQTSLDTADFSEESCISTMEAMPFGLGLFWHYLFKSLMYLIYRDSKAALEASLKAEENKHFISGLMMYPDHYFVNTLVLTANWDSFSQDEQQAYLAMMQRNLKQMKTWMEHCPDNFRHRYLLMRAEMARVSGEHEVAMEHYELAIEACRESEYLHHEALANELAGHYYLNKGYKRAAKGYLVEARHCYLHWGAKRKVRYFDQELPELALTADELWSRETISTTSHTQALDFNSVMKASQAISGEIVLERLLKKLMDTLMENAGAEKGLLLLEDGISFSLRAQGSMSSHGSEVLLATRLSDLKQDELLAQSVLNYAIRTNESVVLDDAGKDEKFAADAYVIRHCPKSVLCTPLLNQGKMYGLVYLENNLTTGAFTPDRLEIINLLSAQAAISIENATLYNTLEQKVEERTAELQIEVGERKRAEQELIKLNWDLTQLAALDGLTQIANRRYFDEYLASEWSRMQRDKSPISLIFCDIDCFKQYNDAYGHQMGDDCLKQVAQAMKTGLKRPADLAARYGGEEFVLLLPNTDQEGLRHIAELLHESVRALNIEHSESGVSNQLTISMGGVTLLPDAELSTDMLISLADKALYRAKENGRNRLEVSEANSL